MKIQMLRNLVGVEKLGKSSKRQSGTLFAETEVTHNLGIIRYIGEQVENLRIGQKVYIGNQREEIRMEGSDIMVMEVSNVIAIVEDSNGEDQNSGSEA
jgi:co-chaperonin GroES (HSP10)